MRVHFPRKPDPDSLADLQSALDPGIELTFGDLSDVRSDVRILIAGRPTREELDALPDLETLIIPWTGIPLETLELARGRRGLKVHNLHYNAAPTAELAVALLLAAAKRIIPFDRELRQGDWSMRYEDSGVILLDGKHALILGYGRIGQRIARALEGLGVVVSAVSRSGQGRLPRLYSQDKLQDLLPHADFLIVALPLTRETKGMVSDKELGLLPSSAVLVNIARGSIVDQKALYQALAEKRIAAAGLDVWYNYPEYEAARRNTMPGDYPFQELGNVVLSPHRAANVIESDKLRMESLAALLNQAAAGEPMDNQVDLLLGY